MAEISMSVKKIVQCERGLTESNARFWDLAPHHLEANEAFEKN